MSNFEILGFLSAILTLSAFVLNEYGKLSSESFTYDLMNFVAAVGLGVYAFSIGSLPFILTNSVWAIVSGADVVKYLIRKKV